MQQNSDLSLMWDAGASDLKVLITYIWGNIGLPTPSLVQFDMADYMQHGPDRTLITAMRGGAKTYIGCAYIIYRLMNNPNEEILIISKSGDKARDFARLIKEWITTMPLFAPLRAREDQINTVDQFDVGTRTIGSHSASVTAKGITGTITGGRAHFILVDDVETQDNSFTQDQREKLLLKLTECENIIHPGGKIQYNGTFQSEESIYLDLSRQGYIMRTWPARYPSQEEDGKWAVLAPTLQQHILRNKRKPGEPTFPERYPEEELCKRESLMGSSQFALQFLLDPELSDEDRYPLKLRDLVVLSGTPTAVPIEVAWASGKDNQYKGPLVGLKSDRWYKPMYISKEWQKPSHIVMSIDPSGKGKDECAWVVGAMHNTRIFLLDSGGATDGYGDETLTKICASAWENDVQEIVCEPTFGGGLFNKVLVPALQDYYAAQTVQKRPPGVTDSKHPMGMKETRIISAIEPVANQHKLVVSEKVAEDQTLWYQFTRMQHRKDCLKHDDRVDALAQLVTHVADGMAVNAGKLVEKLQEDYRRKEIENFDSRRGNILVFGQNKKKKKNWIRR